MDELSQAQVVAETESFAVWKTSEEEGFVFHLELGGITLHLLPDEWEELVVLIISANEGD